MTATSIPLSAQELCQSVRSAAAFDPSRLDRVLGIDETRGVVEVQSATPWKALAERLRPGDARPRSVQTTYATIGESLACNAAGPDGRPLVEHVESFTMVTPDGHLRRVDRTGNPALFALVVGGQGLFGALYSVTLRLDSLERALVEAQAPAPVAGAGVGAVRPGVARRLVLLVPEARAEALIAGCREACSEWRIALAGASVRRIRSEQETFLRWARRECAEVCVALDAGSNLGAEVRLTQLRRSLIDLAIALGGGFPIAGSRSATREQTEACYPQLAASLPSSAGSIRSSAGSTAGCATTAACSNASPAKYAGDPRSCRRARRSPARATRRAR
jgi:FAD/FMN-containing dehydrogenase